MIGTPVKTTTRWGAEIMLSAFASEGAVDAELRKAGVLRDGRWPDGARFDYPRDEHFARYVLNAISTMEDAEAFLTELDRAAARRGFMGSGCTKAFAIRRYLSKEFWREDADRMRGAISRNRRVMCGCHEAGSFAEHRRASAERGHLGRTAPSVAAKAA